MAPMWHLGVKSLCWTLHALVLMTLEVQTVSATSCTDIHSEAFGNDALKPGVCYLVSNTKGVFLDARTFCQGLNDSLGWDVADIEDAVDQQLIHDAIAPVKVWNTDYFWIGQNDMKTEGVWRYVNDSSNKCNQTVYLNWAPNQPNGGGRQNCMMYYYDGDSVYDVRCDFSYAFLCKVKLTTDTVPFCPNFTEDTTTEAPDECVNVLPDAFGNPSVSGVCYVSDSYQTRTFEEALGFCQSLPGGNWSVVEIEDADENFFIEVWNRDNFPNNEGYWIGQNDREQEGDFRYTSSGQCPAYLNWHESQPDGFREENCLVMFKRDGRSGKYGTFYDKDCNGTDRYYTLCKLNTGLNQSGGFPTSCNENRLSTEVAACSSLRADTFGRLDKSGVCYLMTGQKLNWSSAVDFCKNEGWSLVDIDNATENDMLATAYRNFAPSGQDWWVGQNDREVEGTWKYLSNDTPSDAGVFLNFGNNRASSESEDCLVMDTSSFWNDRNCANEYFVTCKKRIDIIPAEPCTGSSSFTRPRRFVFVSSDATCDPQDTLAPSYHAKGSMQCARDCLSRHDCKGFGFLAAGKEDDCVLCSRVQSVHDLQFKAGSRYYNEAL